MEGRLTGAEAAEYANLRGMVAQIEVLLTRAGDFQTISLLSSFLEGAKTRMAGLEREAERRAEEERRTEQQQGVAALVEREKALSEAEKREYADLLERDHFTRADFGRLEHFYSNSWDNLTEEGKDQVDYRLWEGVRQHEFKFDELPEEVKERQAHRLEQRLKNPGAWSQTLEGIPAGDRQDFLNAREGGDREQSYAVMNRPAFAPHVALTKGKSPVREAAVAEMTQKSEEAQPKNPPSKADDAAQNLGSIKLDMPGLRLQEAAKGNHRPPLTGSAGNPAVNQPDLISSSR